ncbi:MAG TPA: nucleotidyltransferase family protein [Tepidisphaeraceae bacterium]|nr:nucleotidyltransferase family protein [Tepidisphaeraceae bacterium]
MNEPQVAGIILAAGASTRMGQLKQELVYRGQSLLLHAVETALAGDCRPVVVVLGCQAQRFRRSLRDLPVHVAENPAWSEGLGTSIGRGVQAANSLSDSVEAVLLMLCDQPLVTPALLQQMIAEYRQGKYGIVGCEYAETVGPPVLFARRYFTELQGLRGSAGAKRLIEAHRQEACLIPFPAGQADIDTPSDYARLR